MKKKLFFILSIIAIIKVAIAKQVNPVQAKIVAQNMYRQVSGDNGSINLFLAYTAKFRDISNTQATYETPLYYIFNAEDNKGFVIVSANDNVYPVLGYATEGNLNMSSGLAQNFKKWLENYKNQIIYVITNHLRATELIKSQWKKLENGDLLNANKNANSVNPLLTTTWSQSPYYNDLCPYDVNAGAANGYHAVTGCPATAMAQIMKYWNYPATGTGFHSYNHPYYGTLSANFGATTYDWASMPDHLSGPNNAVATLMYHCGVAVEMQYGPTSSGSYVIMDGYPQEQTCEYAYKTYFGYDPNTIQGLRRSNYSDSAWIQLLKNELDAGRPVQYAGFGQGGHTFVCDGYDINNYFHMNWGWGGYADGYFLIDALNPGSGGTGAGAGTYNNGQQAIIGIQPLQGGNNNTNNFDITLYDYVTANPNPVWFGSPFTVHTDVANWSQQTFTGDWTAAIFDSNYNFLDFVEILSGYTLNGNSHYTNGLDFSTQGMINILPGSYYIGIFYRPTGGDWVIAGINGSYTNLIPFQVYYSNDIELYQDMVIDVGNTIENNQPFTVTLDILNDGNSTFYGEFGLSLYDLDGNFAATVETITGAALDPGYYYDDVQFSTTGINVPAGTYLLALEHKPNGGNWELTGSTYHANPIYVTIVDPPLQPDMYENNDTENNAYTFSVNFNGNQASVSTNGSNLHIGTDDDYYKINLPSGYNYTITARAHDSYNSGNGNTYTCDVSWVYKNGNNWSDTYDDVMPGNITVNNGGTVYFKVSPFFVGETGTYLLDIQITRTGSSGINENSPDNNISVYPNPVSNYLQVKTKDFEKVKSIKILDVSGRQMTEFKHPLFNNHIFSVPVNHLTQGNYIISIETGKNIVRKKFIKTK